MAQTLAIIALLVSVASAAIAWRIGMRTVRITTYRSATDLMLEVDRVFIAHPCLRPYFYDDQVCAKGDKDYDLVQAVAELELDVLECIWDGRDNYSYKDQVSWAKYIKDSLAASPALKAMHADAERANWYPTLDDLLSGKTEPPPERPNWWGRRRRLAARLSP
ncbi:hypothetical protein ACWGID_19045 [Kribbella sp. NPDC054772]